MKNAKLSTEVKVEAGELLEKFLQDNNIQIGLSPIKFRKIEDGSIILDVPKILVGYKQ